MDRIFFYNFSARNYPDFSKKSFGNMLIVNGHIKDIDLKKPPVKCKKVDLNNQIVLPPFADAHVHFGQTAISHIGCDLSFCDSIAHLCDLIAREASLHPMVLGWNLEETKIKENRLPSREELNKVSSDKFIFLVRRDMHSAIANDAAIKWACSIIPELDTSNLTISGKDYYRLLYEMVKIIPRDLFIKGMKAVEQHCFTHGTAYIHSLEGAKGFEQQTILTADYLRNSKLNEVIYHQSEDVSLNLTRGWKQMGGCILVDGSLGTRTAALTQRYNDADTTGDLYLNDSKIKALLSTSRKHKMQLALHAIGDAAISTVCTNYCWAKKNLPANIISDRIEHFVMANSNHIESAANTSTMICVQPAFDSLWGGANGLYSKRLGTKRALNLNKFRSMLNSGLVLAASSDSPVTEINPLFGIQALVRHNHHQERISLNNALTMYIINPHILSGQSELHGKLAPGKKADFVCLANDPFEVCSDQLSSIKINSLYLEGVNTLAC